MEEDTYVIQTAGGFTHFGVLDAESGDVRWFARFPEGSRACQAAKRMLEETRLVERQRISDREWTLLVQWAVDADEREYEAAARALIGR